MRLIGSLSLVGSSFRTKREEVTTYWVEMRHLRNATGDFSPSHVCLRCREKFGDIVDKNLICVFTDPKLRTTAEVGREVKRPSVTKGAKWWADWSGSPSTSGVFKKDQV